MVKETFIKNIPNKAILYVFDIDDTLFHTSARIGVIKNGSIVRYLSNSEFNEYKLKRSESYNFDEFRSSSKFFEDSKPIRRLIDTVISIQKKMPFAVVTFNTAREDFDDKNLFLATFEAYGIDTSKLHVNRAGNIPEDVHPAYKKIVYIKEYLDTGKISQVHMFDDNTKNLEVVLDLKNEYPTIGFSAWRVKNGTPEKFNRRKT